MTSSTKQLAVMSSHAYRILARTGCYKFRYVPTIYTQFNLNPQRLYPRFYAKLATKLESPVANNYVDSTDLNIAKDNSLHAQSLSLIERMRDYLDRGHINMLIKDFIALQQLTSSPIPMAYNIMLKACEVTGDWRCAMMTWKAMSHVNPGTSDPKLFFDSCCSLLLSLSRAGELNHAFDLYDKSLKDMHSIQQRLEMHLIMLQACANESFDNDAWKNAYHIVQRMEKEFHGINSNERKKSCIIGELAHIALIELFARHHKPSLVVAVWKYMQSEPKVQLPLPRKNFFHLSFLHDITQQVIDQCCSPEKQGKSNSRIFSPEIYCAIMKSFSICCDLRISMWILDEMCAHHIGSLSKYKSSLQPRDFTLQTSQIIHIRRCYNYFLRMCGEHYAVQLAIQVFEHMQYAQIPPDTETFSIMLRLCSLNANKKRHMCVPSHYTSLRLGNRMYRELQYVRGTTNGNNILSSHPWDLARIIYAQSKKLILPVVERANLIEDILRALCTVVYTQYPNPNRTGKRVWKNNHLYALKVIEESSQEGIQPTVIMFHHFIRSCNNIQGLGKKIYSLMLKYNVRPTIKTFNLLLKNIKKKRHCPFSRINYQIKLIQNWMEQNGFIHTTETCNQLLRIYCLGGYVNATGRVLRTMKSHNIPKNYETYKWALECFCRQRKLRKFRGAISLLKMSQEDNIPQKPYLFNMVAIRATSFGLFNEVIELWNNLKTNYTVPDLKSYTPIIVSLMNLDRWKHACSILEEMRIAGYHEGVALIKSHQILDVLINIDNFGQAKLKWYGRWEPPTKDMSDTPVIKNKPKAKKQKNN